MALDPTDDPAAALEELASCMSPWLFGVRHHSPACSIALPPLLDRLQPDAIAIELPEDLGHWMEWLGHPEAEAPLAVAAVSRTGEHLGFYPFADFSPELVAIRWAREHEVPVHAIDLPSASRGARDRCGELAGIGARLPGTDDDSWEHMVEAPATAQAAERVRRAALLYGWALRLDQARGSRVSDLDLAREQHMRAVLERIGASKKKIAAIIGSFHAAALVPEPALWRAPSPSTSEPADLVSSLIPYAFELLDARSGYPAGIRDPSWHQRLWQTQRDRGDVAVLVAQCLVEITRLIRAKGLPASVPDARAAAEIAISLAALRGLAAPGRRELVEAVQTALSQGELMGRGRIVASAMESVLVGRHRGHLAPGTPRSGLAPHVFALMEELRLPGVPAKGKPAMTEPEDIRLDPLRSPLDRRRHVALARMRACGIPYGTELESVAAGGVESLTSVWRVMFTPTTEAVIELAGLRGVTLKQASAGALRAEAQRLAVDEKLSATALVVLTETAAEAGAGELVREWLAELTGKRLAEATLAELIALIAVIDRILAGHVVALPTDEAVPGEIDAFEPPAMDRAMVLGIAVASILGLAGSESLDDARALAELVRLLERPEHQGVGDGRLRWSIDQLVETGTPVIAGAAEIVRVLIGTQTAEALAQTIGAWIDGAASADARRVLANRLRGAISIAGPLFESAPVFLDGMLERVERLTDEDFLARVTALRDGFETLSTASRKRLLRSLGDRLGESDARGQGLDVVTSIPPALLVAAAEADRAGRAAADRIARPALLVPQLALDLPAPHVVPDHGIPVRDRWRMILGHERDRMKPRSLRVARALDELYGQGHGEGSREGQGGGQEHGFPTVRAWKDEIDELFGTRVFEEVAAKAALHGRVGALLEVDPAQVQPSIELLEQVLSLKGGLGEAHLGRLRTLIKRIVDELVRELAIRVRPAMQGAISARPTRRSTGVLHLPRTVAANLARTRVADDGAVSIIPEKLIFKTRSRRHMDWHVVLVVDVSGSMEPSVIYSAMMAAILSAVPWIDVRFIAFSTEIVDLSDHVSDPLALLLEVSVGGGTHIAKGLRYAKSLITVPQRTIMIVVSDFEEGYSVDALVGEVRALVEAGVTCLGLAALDDRGAPRYSVQIAEQIVGAGMPVAALTPLELARWIGEKIR